jgi:hypothetical protein
VDGGESADVDRYEKVAEKRNDRGMKDGKKVGLVTQSNFETRAAMNEIEELTPSMYAALEAIEAQGGPKVREQISWEKMGSGKWRCWVKKGHAGMGDAGRLDGAREAGAGGGKKSAETSHVVLDQAVEGSRVMGLEKVWDLKRRVELPAGVAEAEEGIRKRLMEESGMVSRKREIGCVDGDNYGDGAELRDVYSSGHASKRIRI